MKSEAGNKKRKLLWKRADEKKIRKRSKKEDRGRHLLFSLVFGGVHPPLVGFLCLGFFALWWGLGCENTQRAGR